MKYKRSIAIVMMVAVFLIMSTSSTAAAPNIQKTAALAAISDTTANIKGKDEVVYANLAPGGKVNAIYAVNRFEVLTAGNITDYGDYSSVVNLTNTSNVDYSGGVVSFAAEEGNFYYQGNMKSTDLPWQFDFSYKLDGEVIQPEELAGKAGKLEIGISSSANAKLDATFYDNYMLQITVTLDTEKCGNINAPDATLANAGSSKVLAFTVLPGKDAAFTIKADVNDFEMAGISVSAMPYSMSIEFPDMDDKFEDLEKLPEAISDLNEGVGQMESGSKDIKKGANQLVGGSKGIKNGLDMINKNGGQLQSGSAQIKTALSQMASALKDSGLESIDLSQVAQLPDGLQQISGGLKELSGGLSQLKEGFVPAYSALDQAMSGIPAAAVSQEQIQALYASLDPSMHDTLGQLVGNYTAAQTAKGTYQQVKPAFEAVATTADTMKGGLDTMAATLDSISGEIASSLTQLDGLDQLGELSKGLSQLSSSYSSYHSGLGSYLSGVNKLASNYRSFHSGLSSFSSGIGELNTGIGELHDGTSTLKEEVQDLPDVMQEELDKMKEQYLPADFETVSFISEKNTKTEFVQFVIQCDGIEKEEEPVKEEPVEQKKETIWDRFTALFS